MSKKLTGEDLEKALKERNLPSTGSADEKRAAVAEYDAKASATASAKTGDEGDDEPNKGTKVVDDATKSEGTTTLDSHLDAPSVTAPGDGPADTTDPSELASSATPDKGTAAKNGDLTVNAVVKVGDAPKTVAPPTKEQRIEKYKATKPNGDVVTVTHNLDTGDTSVS